MGQQQLLLIVLGVIIVGIAIAVGISMFKSNAQSSNRDQVINDLNNLAAKAQQYFRKPLSMAGGGQSFAGFGLAPIDTGNANGLYSIAGVGNPATAPTLGNYAVSANTGAPGSAQDTSLIITGWGTEVGNNASYKVEAYITVTPNAQFTTVLN